MSCPNAAGTITRGPLFDVSITDRSAAFPRCAAVHRVLGGHTHILCFQITHKFVLSLSHWPLPDSLNNVVYMQQLSLDQSKVWNTHEHFETHQMIIKKILHSTVLLVLWIHFSVPVQEWLLYKPHPYKKWLKTHSGRGVKLKWIRGRKKKNNCLSRGPTGLTHIELFLFCLWSPVDSD